MSSYAIEPTSARLLPDDLTLGGLFPVDKWKECPVKTKLPGPLAENKSLRAGATWLVFSGTCEEAGDFVVFENIYLFPTERERARAAVDAVDDERGIVQIVAGVRAESTEEIDQARWTIIEGADAPWAAVVIEQDTAVLSLSLRGTRLVKDDLREIGSHALRRLQEARSKNP